MTLLLVPVQAVTQCLIVRHVLLVKIVQTILVIMSLLAPRGMVARLHTIGVMVEGPALLLHNQFALKTSGARTIAMLFARILNTTMGALPAVRMKIAKAPAKAADTALTDIKPTAFWAVIAGIMSMTKNG